MMWLWYGLGAAVPVAVSLQLEYGLAEQAPWLPALLGACVGAAVGVTMQAILQKRDAPPPRPSGPALAAGALFALLAVAFVLAHVLGAVHADFIELHQGLLRMGGHAPGLIRDGQPWRAAAAPLLHGGTIHATLNGLAVLVLGRALERRAGASATVACFFGPALIASAVIGLLAAGGLWTMASAGAFGLALALGAGLAAALRGAGARRRWAKAAVAVSAVFGVAVSLAGLGLALRPTDDAAQRADLLALAATLPDSSKLNEVAWKVAVDPDASPERLALGSALSDRSLALEPGAPQLIDTRATLSYRLGLHREAAELELTALALRPRYPFFASQIARFARAHAAKAEAPLDREALPATALGWDRFTHGLVLWWPRGAAPMAVFEAKGQGGEVWGTVVAVATSSVTGSEWFRLPREVTESLDGEGRLELLWVQPRPEGWPPGLRAITHDAAVDALP